MPANLTADFIKARKQLRQASTPEEKLACLEEMLATIPKHKGTDHMQADIKKRIAKMRGAVGGGKKGRGHGYDHISKEGAGQVVLIGPPNAGKSSLLAALTNAKPEVAAYPFSTTVPVPGMMAFEDIMIQLIDLPPVTSDYTETWVYSLIRSADLAVVVMDATDGELIEEELGELLEILESKNTLLVEEAATSDDTRIRMIPTRGVLTKCEDPDADPNVSLPFPGVRLSTESGQGLDAFRRDLFDALHIVRIYTKLPGHKPDMTEPYTLPEQSTVLDAVKAVHRDFVDRLKYVRIWGSGRFDGQQVPSDHVLEDGDIVEIHLR